METSDYKYKADLISRLKTDFDADKSVHDRRLTRMKTDLAYATGSVKDSILFGDYESIRGKDRAFVFVPILAPFVRKMVSQYLANPYGIVIQSENPELEPYTQELQKDIAKIEKKSNAKYEFSNTLLMTGGCGRGYLYATTEEHGERNQVLICGVEDSRNVVFDRNAKRLDGSDARRAFYQTSMSVKEAKAEYGERVVNGYGSNGFLGDRQPKDEDSCPVVTCWEMRRETNTCWVTKIVGNEIVSESDTLVPYLLIIPVYGILQPIKDGMDYVSLTHNANGIQNMADFAASNLQERMAVAPVSRWVIDTNSVDTNTVKTIQEAHKSLHPAVLWNSKGNDGQGAQAPQKVDPATNVSDLTEVISVFTNLASVTIGYQGAGVGLDERKNETAESVLLRAKENETSIADIYSNLEVAVCQLGRVLCHLLVANDPKYQGLDVEQLDVDVTAGPMMLSTKRDKLKRTMALMGMLEDPAEKKLLYGDLAENLDGVSDDTVQVFKMIADNAKSMLANPAQPVDNGAQMQALNDALAQKDAEMQQANLYIQQLQFELASKQAEIQKAVTVETIKGDNAIKLEAFKQQGKQTEQQIKIAGQSELEAQKSEAELAKAVLKMGAEQNPIADVRPDYTSVGGMRNNLMP